MNNNNCNNSNNNNMYLQQSYCHPSQQQQQLQQQQQMMMMGGGGGGVGDYCGGMGQHHYMDPSDPSGSGGSHFSLDDLNFDPAYMMDNNGADDLAVNVFIIIIEMEFCILPKCMDALFLMCSNFM